jgi:hypothetical protein
MAKPELTGYALKASRGERPFIYSDEHAAWRRNPESDDARAAWARKHGPNKRARYKPCIFGDEKPLI